jgi:hypothetical protein
MNSSTKQNEKLIFQRKSLENLKRVKLDLRTFNVLMAIDGKRSVADIISDDIYDPTFLNEKIQLLLSLGLIEATSKTEKNTNTNVLKRPTTNGAPPTAKFEKEQATDKQHTALEHLAGLLKAPLFWYIVGCLLVAFLLTSIPMMMHRTQVDPAALLRPPPPEPDTGDEQPAEYSNIESNTSKTDREQVINQGGDAAQSDEPPAEYSNIESNTSKTDREQVINQGGDAAQSPELTFVEPAPLFIEPAHRVVEPEPVFIEPAHPIKESADRTNEDQPKEMQVGFHNDDMGPPAQPRQVKTKRPYVSLKKKPIALKLPFLAVTEIKSKTLPVSETQFLQYMDQTGPKSNWKEILHYASRLWRLEAPGVAQHDHFSDYLEYYNKHYKNRGLAIHSAICTLHQLKVFNMPAILEFHDPRQEVSKYLVIKKIDYQRAVLNNGKSKEDIIITHHQLDRLWSGISHIPWKKVIQSADIINTESPPVVVKELKAYLNSVGFHNLDEPGIYNPRTASAVKKIQTRFGITPTGLVDVVTHAAFNRYRDRMRSKTEPQRKT